MNRSRIAVVFATLLAAGSVVHAQRGYDLFQKALAIERVDGNLTAAIKLYESAVDVAGSDRALAARALIRIADCYEKLGQRNATAVYQRIIKEYADQPDLVALARTRVAALRGTETRVQSLRQVWSGPEVDPMGTPSADGRLLSFTDWTTGDLSVRDLSTGTSRHLTRTGGWEKSGDFAEYSVISPDGRSVAYSWFVDRGGDAAATKCRCEYELRVAPIAASDPATPRVLIPGTPLTWVRPGAWLPDGRTLLVLRGSARGPSDVGLVSTVDGTYRKVTSLPVSNTSMMGVSADGTVAALDVPANGTTGDHDIIFVSLASGQQVATLGGAGNDTSATFAKNGSHLLFVSDRTGSSALWRQPLRNSLPAGDPVIVGSVASDAILQGTTPDGGVLYFAPGSGTNVFEVDIDGATDAGNRGRLLVDRFLDKNLSPSYSPDGGQLAFISRRGARAGMATYAIVIHDVRTGADRELPVTVPIIQESALSWFPDGRTLLAVAQEPRASGLDYYKIDVSTAAAEKVLTTGDAGRPTRRPIVLPDGRTIIYSDRPERSFEGSGSSLLRAYDLTARASREIRRLGGTDDYVTSFTVSPDGRDIAYLRFESARREAILEVIPATGGGARELFREVNYGPTRSSGLAWSVDGRTIYLVRETNADKAVPAFTIWGVPVSGGAPAATRVTLPGAPRFLAAHPRGGRLIYSLTSVHAEAGVWLLENYLTGR